MKTALILLATLIPSIALADPTMGPATHRDVVSPGEVDQHYIYLNGRETTRFVVQGDGDGDIDCFIFDDNDRLVARDSDQFDNCLIDVTPRYTAQFSIKVVNNGRIASAYFMRAF